MVTLPANEAETAKEKEARKSKETMGKCFAQADPHYHTPKEEVYETDFYMEYLDGTKRWVHFHNGPICSKCRETFHKKAGGFGVRRSQGNGNVITDIAAFFQSDLHIKKGVGHIVVRPSH